MAVIKEDAAGMIPQWRIAPCRADHAVTLQQEELYDKLDGYFTETAEQGRMPSFCDLAGACGFDSVSQLANHAQRKPEFMRAISRCLLAVGASYEELLQQGSKQAAWMLERIPQFDSVEPAGSPPSYPWQVTKQSQVFLTGVEREQDRGSHMSEQDAYLEVIKHKTYAEVEAIVLRDDDPEDVNVLIFDGTEEEDSAT